MLTDRYGLALTTTSAAARDAYVAASDLMLTLFPGEAEAYDRAIAADPDFALPYVGKALVLIRLGQVAEAMAALAAAKERATGVSEREASHIHIFDLVFTGQTDAAIAAVHAHLATWPRDAFIVDIAASPAGVIGNSGRIGQKHQIAALMDNIAPHYGDDFWFLSYHAMALAEDGQLRAARAKAEQSLATNPNNGHGAHGFAHVCYESGDVEAGRRFLSSWLPTYPRAGFFHGHLKWHQALFAIQAGDWAQARRLYEDDIALDRHMGVPQLKVMDGASFLWRSELAGCPRDSARWRELHAYVNSMLPKPSSGLADLHALLTQAAMRDDTGLDVRSRQMNELAGQGHYPSGAYLPTVARGLAAFEQGDFADAIAALAPVVGDSERIGGSRAQLDVVELTLLRAYINANRPEDARRLREARRPGAAGVAVQGLASAH